MKFKIFSSKTRMGLEEEIAKWLETHPVAPSTMSFQYSAFPHDDDTAMHTEYTLALFYVPFTAIG